MTLRNKKVHPQHEKALKLAPPLEAPTNPLKQQVFPTRIHVTVQEIEQIAMATTGQVFKLLAKKLMLR